ncbi:hypothetical protein ACFQV4_08545 [Streptomyces thermocarboxydus]
MGSVVHFPARRATRSPCASPAWSPPRTGRTLLVHDSRTGRPHRMVTQGPVPSQYWAAPCCWRRTRARRCWTRRGARAVLEPGPRPRGPSRP